MADEHLEHGDELPTSSIPPPIGPGESMEELFASAAVPTKPVPSGASSPSQQTKIPKAVLAELAQELKPLGYSVRSASDTKVDGHFSLSTLKSIVEAIDRFPYELSVEDETSKGLGSFRGSGIRDLAVPIVNLSDSKINKDHIVAVRINPDERASVDVGNVIVALSQTRETLEWKPESMLIVPLPDQLFEQAKNFAYDSNKRGKYLQIVDPTKNPQLLALDMIQLLIDMPGSDLHLDYSPDGDLIPRIRKDGKLQPIRVTGGKEIRLDNEVGVSLVSTFMLLGKLDIADKQMLQDGVIPLATPGFFEEFEAVFGQADESFLEELRTYSLRVAYAPTVTGSSVTLRLLATRSAEQETLDSAGLSPHVTTALREVLALPQGLVVVSGPTGSGKSTTLYKGLTEINTGDLSIATVEDPVERLIPGARQLQIGLGRNKDKRAADFIDCLRSIVRMDPDVILIGETRDFDTAEIVIQSSATGHLVFTTTHANDAEKTLQRLASFRKGDAEIDKVSLYSTVELLFAQRLPRRTCDNCVGESEASHQFEPLTELSGVEFSTDGLVLPIASGDVGGSECPTCYGEGYDKRVPVAEYFRINDDIVDKLNIGASSKELRSFAIANGNYKPFAWDAFRLILSGKTDLNEISRKLALKTLVDEAATLEQMLVLLCDEETTTNAVATHLPVMRGKKLNELSAEQRSDVVSAMLSDFISEWRGVEKLTKEA